MISLRGVAVHNLKNIDLDLPLGKLIVFCGRSGSGKSSLALDTLYAEGQRRYIETFSPAMRQFLEKIEKPKAERLDGIPPAIAVTSSLRKMNSMTVGEATELHDYLAMLFAQQGHVFCPKCSRLITADSPQTIWERLCRHSREGGNPSSPPLPLGEGRGEGCMTFCETAPLTLSLSLKGGEGTFGLQIAFAPPLEETPAEFADLWKEQGFLRGCFGNAVFRLDEPIPAELYRKGLLLIVDRLTFDPNEEDRIIESLETAFDYGDGKCFVLLSPHPNPLPEGDGTITLPFSRSLSCEYCNVHVPPLTPKLFRTDWINHVHLDADVNSPTMNDLCRLTAAELLRFFDEIG